MINEAIKASTSTFIAESKCRKAVNQSLNRKPLIFSDYDDDDDDIEFETEIKGNLKKRFSKE